MSEGDSTQGLICAFCISGPGRAVALDWDGVNNWRPEQGLLWVHLDFTQPGSRQWLEDSSGVPPNICEALLAEDGRPRSFRDTDNWLVMLRGVNLNVGAQADDMVAVRLWLESNRIISTRRRRLQSVTNIRRALESGAGIATPGQFLVELLNGLAARIGDAVDNLETQIEEAEARASEESSASLQIEIASLRRQCARMRRHLTPQREALDHLARTGGGCVGAEEIDMVRETGDRMMRALEDLDLARERAMVAHEEFVARVAQEQNARIYLLSIVAAVFLPLSFLTGLFGMNVAGLPGMEDPRAFLVVSGVMLSLAVVALVVFRLKRWI